MLQRIYGTAWPDQEQLEHYLWQVEEARRRDHRRLGRELELCREGAETWARASGNQVRLVPVPNSASERLALFQQMLAAHATDIDVFQLDVVWSGS